MKQVITSAFFLFFLNFFLPATASAFPQQEKDTVAIKYSKTITAEDLKKHLSVLASDEYQGRETGQKGQKMSAEYISEQFKREGIPPYKNSTYYQKYPITVSVPQEAQVIINGKKYEFREDFYHFPGIKKQCINTSAILFLGYGIHDKNYDDYKRIKTKKKAAMVMGGEPIDADSIYFVSGKKQPSEWTTNYRKKRETAQANGISLLLVVDFNFNETIGQIDHLLTSSSMKLLNDKKKQNEMPIIYISERMANEILSSNEVDIMSMKKRIQEQKNLIFKKIKTKINIKFTTKEEQISAENVIGFVEGGDLKNEYLFVTAHYDHLGARGEKIFNGADDDGSGTVAVIEMAEAFAKAKKDGHGPRRSVVFMTVSGEEKGLLGSKYYTSNPIFPLEQTVCDLNIDMIGRVDEKHQDSANYVYIIGSNFISTELHDINEISNRKYTHLNLDYTYNSTNDKNRFYYRSDHYNFAKKNVPVIFYFNGTHEDYHKETDEIGKIKFDIMERRARLVFFTAWEVANRPLRIKKDVKN